MITVAIVVLCVALGRPPDAVDVGVKFLCYTAWFLVIELMVVPRCLQLVLCVSFKFMEIHSYSWWGCYSMWATLSLWWMIPQNKYYALSQWFAFVSL